MLRVGSRVLIPMADLLQFCRTDHPARLVGEPRVSPPPFGTKKRYALQVYLQGVSRSYLT
jgi:hypothetical protein